MCSKIGAIVCRKTAQSPGIIHLQTCKRGPPTPHPCKLGGLQLGGEPLPHAIGKFFRGGNGPVFSHNACAGAPRMRTQFTHANPGRNSCGRSGPVSESDTITWTQKPPAILRPSAGVCISLSPGAGSQPAACMPWKYWPEWRHCVGPTHAAACLASRKAAQNAL